jgi:arginine transport system substrate-binding protein
MTKSTGILLLVALVGFSTGIMWYVTHQQKANSDSTLTVGMIIGYAPFASIAPDGSYEGFDVDVAQAIATKMNKTLIIKDMDLPALFIALEQQKIDMVLTGLSITPEREKAVNMIHYVGEPLTSFPLVFWNTIPAGVASLSDLTKKFPDTIVCVEPGSTQEKFLINQVPASAIRQIDTMIDIIMNLKHGKAQAALLDPDIYPSFRKNYPELQSIEIPLPAAYQTRGMGIAVNKNNPELTAQLNTMVADLKKSGFIKEHYNRWFGQ